MSVKYQIIAGLCLLAPAAFAATAADPTPGYYAETGYVASATPAATCKNYGIVAGTSYAGVFYYPGPSATGAIFRQPSASSGGASVTPEYFSKTPAKGVYKWSGKLMEDGVTSPFTATLTPLDASSFTGVFKATILGNCSVVDNLAFVKTGS